jgi:hypothetical protein
VGGRLVYCVFIFSWVAVDLCGFVAKEILRFR